MLGCVKENVLNWSHPVLVYETPTIPFADRLLAPEKEKAMK
jgi:hypothetical protein